MKIVTDRAANLTATEEEKYEITVAPLYIQFPEGEVDSSTLEPDEFYQRLIAMKPVIPTTALPSSGFFSELFDRIAQPGEEILSIHLSSGLSGTIESARLGAEQAENADVTIFDTKTLSGGQRFQVLAASMAVEAGWELDKTIERLEQIRDQVEVVYSLDTLDYLEHGGRIGRVQSLLSSLLSIKPVIHVDHSDGKYSTVGKARTLARTLQEIAAHLEGIYRDEPLWVTILHGQLAKEAEDLASLLKDRLTVKRSEILRVTPVLGVHTGPGIVGVAAMPMSLMADITH